MVKTNYLVNELIESYAIFKYDNNGNCISQKDYDKNGTIQLTIAHEFDNQNRVTKSIEFTAKKQIWEWYETQYPNDNTIIYLSKNKNGIVEHKTIENTKTGEVLRYQKNGILYATIKKKYDKANRLINSQTINNKGIVIEENRYSYKGNSVSWKLFVEGNFIKTEETEKDRNGNVEYYIRKDKNGQSLEWNKSEYDDFNNVISIENGIQIDKATNKTLINYEYLE